MAKQHNLRKGRISEAGRAYLLTIVTAARRPILRDFHCASVVARSIHYHGRAGWVENLAWVIMPDHVHWLLVLQERGRLDQLMRSFKSYTAQTVNALLGGVGAPLWQPGYHDHAVRRDEDLRRLARYVIANPLRAGLTEDLGLYPWWDATWL